MHFTFFQRTTWNNKDLGITTHATSISYQVSSNNIFLALKIAVFKNKYCGFLDGIWILLTNHLKFKNVIFSEL